MDYQLSEALNLVLRWLHVVAAIFWIGQTALFAWLDHRMAVAAKAGEGDVFMVHSGGFYRVAKEPVAAPLPATIHWFKWEAAITWGSGFGLLVLVYYLGGALVAADGPLGPGGGIALSVGLLVAGWAVYDAIWRSPLGRRERAATMVCLVLLLAACLALPSVLTGRGAYIQVGAMLGTVMAANVWMRILPPQRRMIAQAAAGGPADPRLGEGAKLRSKHNTFLALPLVLIMLANHFPVSTYGHRHAGEVLFAILLTGFAVRWGINRHERMP